MAEPHFETNVFGVWLLLLALAALTAPSEPARTRALAVFGLLAGLAWWTSFKVIEVLAPALLLLVLRGPRRSLGREGALVAGGFLARELAGLALLRPPRGLGPGHAGLGGPVLQRRHRPLHGPALAILAARDPSTAGNVLLATDARRCAGQGSR